MPDEKRGTGSEPKRTGNQQSRDKPGEERARRPDKDHRPDPRRDKREPQHRCPHLGCKTVCTQKSNLCRHLREVHRDKERRFFCDICGDYFARGETLERHMKTHSKNSAPSRSSRPVSSTPKPRKTSSSLPSLPPEPTLELLEEPATPASASTSTASSHPRVGGKCLKKLMKELEKEPPMMADSSTSESEVDTDRQDDNTGHNSDRIEMTITTTFYRNEVVIHQEEIKRNFNMNI